MTSTIFSPNRFILYRLMTVALTFIAVVSLSAAWVSSVYADNFTSTTVRPELGKPLQAAKKLLDEKNYRGALGLLQKAESIPDLTSAEKVLIDRFRGAAAAGAGEYALAAKLFEAVIVDGHLQSQEELVFTQAVGELLYQAKDYRNAVVWLKRYIAEGGSTPQTGVLLAQSYYLDGDYAGAAKALMHDIHDAELNGGKPSIQQLELLASCQNKLKDEEGYVDTLEKLVVLASKPEYWDVLIQHVTSRPNFPQRLEIAVGRLRLATGTLGGADRYVDFAEEALQNGIPGVAVTTLDKGFANGMLGQGPGAERQKRLVIMARRRAEADLKDLRSEEVAAASQADGRALVNLGWDYLGYGKANEAVTLIEQGIHKGHLKHSDDAFLDLGIAQLAAGNRKLAIQAFGAIKANDESVALARLWIAYVQSSSNQ